MSRQIRTAELALTSDGKLLLNVASLDVERRLDAIVNEARRQGGAVFVGVAMGRQEVARFRREVELLMPEITGRIVGRRVWRGRAGPRSP